MARNGVSRRDFMRKTAGGALAGSILLEANPMAASPRPTPPSDTIRLAIIGCGMRGGGVLPTAIRLPGVECVAACELWDGRETLAKQIVGKPIFVTRRYQDILDRKDVDCIYAPVPDHWHSRIVIDACKAGKDIYIEKPMTHTVEEGFEIIKAAKDNNRIVQVGSQEPSSVVYQKMKGLFAEKALGDLCLVEAQMGRNDYCGAWGYTIPPGLSPENLDWQTWQAPAVNHVAFDKTRWTRWRCFSDYGEGIPGDLFVHHLTGIHYSMGITDPPRRAFTQGGLYRWKDGRDAPDVMTTVYDYPGFSLTLRVTLNTDTGEGFHFMGNHGVLEVDGVENPSGFSITPQDGLDHGPCTPGWPSPLRQDYDRDWRKDHSLPPDTAKLIPTTSYQVPDGYDSTREHLWNFFQSVKTRQPSIEGPEFGNACAIACHMANYSYFKQTVAVWDADAREIKG
ncbi:MAG: Gfo/Idh/MocA family oxidoreductase [Acidobacteriota bacterium]|nr:Gfo/Idh/MocA family oxidoreductase [Acidobacteriota bacterium]